MLKHMPEKDLKTFENTLLHCNKTVQLTGNNNTDTANHRPDANLTNRKRNCQM